MALQRIHCPLPVIDEILPDLGKPRVYSKADLKDGFLQVVDDESSRLTTSQTPLGQHRWLRITYGISPAPEYFQQKLDQNLQGLPSIYRIADDLVIVLVRVTLVKMQVRIMMQTLYAYFKDAERGT